MKKKLLFLGQIHNFFIDLKKDQKNYEIALDVIEEFSAF